MTQQEFEQRIWHKVSVEEYAAVEREYMELPDELDIFKDEFCRLWREAKYGDNRQSSIANYLLVTGLKEKRELQWDVKFYKSLYFKACAEIGTLKGGAV